MVCIKVPWPTREAAEAELAAVREKRLSTNWPGRIECRSYWHPDCGQWHLTSMPKRRG